MTLPESLDIVPERVLDPVRRPSLAARLGAAFGDGVLSLLLNAAVVGWLIQLGWPLRSASTAPEPISVEIVDHVPGEKHADTAGPDTSKAKTTPQAEANPKDSADHPPANTAAQEVNELEPKTEKPATEAVEHQHKVAQSPESVQANRLPAPTPDPAAPASPAVAPGSTEAEPSVPQSTGTAVPPPPEHPNNDARPQLVEAPKPPGPPATEGETTPVAAPPEPAEQGAAATRPATPPSHRDTSLDADVFLPAPAPPPKQPTELTAEQKRQAENTAKLAAILPFGPSIAANPFQGATTGQGSGTSQAYRGAVYGAFAKAKDVVKAAQAQHLRGQAVVAFTLDDQGGLATLGIAVSSGHADVDKAALDYIRHSAPFPPPPPGAQRSFSPAIGFGLDE